ncbi:TrkA domain protein [Halogranum gelatinilyticum]|uniref:TrkA domain protein n=1 Tax=Halogranum gelatinilyticum TaxID=660521 RepID=A0A1G9NZY9_9EURY|nr:TrkA C-terminal domain-containing protein [Halogranum gelatinilyticum]SDL91944.1 TrkA domain protein [Halogranum gelatinilyticum]
MTIYESDLPGVGKKHEIELGDGSRLVIVTHNTGRREVYKRPTPDDDSERLFELSDDLARQVGTILEGAYFQPVKSERIETLLGGNTVLEWVDVDEGSTIAGKTLAETDVRRQFGISIIAIQRGPDTIPSPGGNTTIETGDTLVVLGPRDGCRSFIGHIAGTED